MKKMGIFFGLVLAFGQCLANESLPLATSETVASVAEIDPVKVEKAETGNIKTQVKAAFPELTVDTIKKSPISGFYELTSGPVVLYATNDGRYLVAGDVLDLASEDHSNITEGSRRGARVSVLKQLRTQDMVIYRPSTVKGVVTVFTDADCSYCRKLHAEIPALMDLGIEVRYLAYPRHGVGSATYAKMESVWCSKDPKKAMSRLMSGESVQPLTCRNTIGEQLILGQKLGISGTPTLVFEDGTLWSGYLTAEKLAKEAIKHSSTE